MKSLANMNASIPIDINGPGTNPNRPEISRAPDNPSRAPPITSPLANLSYANSMLTRPPTIGNALLPIFLPKGPGFANDKPFVFKYFSTIAPAGVFITKLYKFSPCFFANAIMGFLYLIS